MIKRTAKANRVGSLHWIIALGALLLLSATGARAQTQYCYTGTSGFTYYTSIYYGGDMVSGCVTLSITLGPNDSSYTNLASDVTDFSFSDGAQTLTPANGDTANTVELYTSGGDITMWDINISGPTSQAGGGTGTIITENDGGGSYDAGSISGNEYFGNPSGSGSPGNWPSPPTLTPEPASASLWLLGLVAMGMLRHRVRLGHKTTAKG